MLAEGHVLTDFTERTKQGARDDIAAPPMLQPAARRATELGAMRGALLGGLGSAREAAVTLAPADAERGEETRNASHHSPSFQTMYLAHRAHRATNITLSRNHAERKASITRHPFQ